MHDPFDDPKEADDEMLLLAGEKPPASLGGRLGLVLISMLVSTWHSFLS